MVPNFALNFAQMQAHQVKSPGTVRLWQRNLRLGQHIILIADIGSVAVARKTYTVQGAAAPYADTARTSAACCSNDSGETALKLICKGFFKNLGIHLDFGVHLL